MANAASVLLKLLKHTNAERLEVMLDPVELLGLLASFGHDKAGIEAKLAKGTKPGELLLELFEEHGADAVWDALPPRAQTCANEAKKTSDEKATIRGQLESVGLGKRRLGGAIVALTGSVWAAMYILGSVPDWGSGLTLGTLVFAVVAGVAGGAWATRDVAATAGAVAGLSCALITIALAWFISGQLDGPPGRLVIIGVVLPGALIGLAIGGAAVRRWSKQVEGF